MVVSPVYFPEVQEGLEPPVEVVVTGRLLAASTGEEVPVLGLEIATEVHALSPAFWKVLTAPEPVTLVNVDERLDAALLVVVTAKATLTEDCNKWRPDGVETEVIVTALD
jgi:hypothetical protein